MLYGILWRLSVPACSGHQPIQAIIGWSAGCSFVFYYQRQFCFFVKSGCPFVSYQRQFLLFRRSGLSFRLLPKPVFSFFVDGLSTFFFFFAIFCQGQFIEWGLYRASDCFYDSPPSKKRASFFSTSVSWLPDTRKDAFKKDIFIHNVACKGLSNDGIGVARGTVVQEIRAGAGLKNPMISSEFIACSFGATSTGITHPTIDLVETGPGAFVGRWPICLGRSPAGSFQGAAVSLSLVQSCYFSPTELLKKIKKA